MTRRAVAIVGAALIGLTGCAAPPAWELPPPPPKEGPVVQPGALTRATLENGLTVMVLEDHRVPTVSVGLAVRRGAGSESLAEAGVAALVA
ncbi:MAG: hypothetical protein MJE66_07255, partial [Proteobacteria bacterium]|nr:hypothetical protein [Pseudomonadota bacterium]